MSSESSTATSDWRKQVTIGTLSPDFLRVSAIQEENDRFAAIHLQNQIVSGSQQHMIARLEVTIIQAHLVKNYGLSRMDPYIRMSVGNHIYETSTDINGSKNPHWNKTFHIYNINRERVRDNFSLFVEIYDERTLSQDQKIAWGAIKIPADAWNGKHCQDWFSLSGKLGPQCEGQLEMRIAYLMGPPPVAAQPLVVMPSYATAVAGPPVYTLPPPVYYPSNAYTPGVASYPVGLAQPPPQPRPVVTEDDIKQLMEMFPEVDRAVVLSVLEATNGNKEATINSLLQM